MGKAVEVFLVPVDNSLRRIVLEQFVENCSLIFWPEAEEIEEVHLWIEGYIVFMIKTDVGEVVQRPEEDEDDSGEGPGDADDDEKWAAQAAEDKGEDFGQVGSESAGLIVRLRTVKMGR